jgi:hypothetical protein
MTGNTGKNVAIGLGMAALLVLGMLTAQTALADGDEEPVDASFQTTGTIVLKQALRGGDFMLLEDVTPLQVVGGHVAMKVPCNRNGDTPLHVLVGSASESGSALVAVELEFIQDISSPGQDCVYHADLDVEDIKNDLLVASGKEVNITDIALANSGERKVHFGIDNGNTVTVNLLTAQGKEDHHDGEE